MTKKLDKILAEMGTAWAVSMKNEYPVMVRVPAIHTVLKGMFTIDELQEDLKFIKKMNNSPENNDPFLKRFVEKVIKVEELLLEIIKIEVESEK